MTKAKWHEITCLNFPNCQNKGMVPLRTKSSRCPECGAREGVSSQFRSKATKEERQAHRESASKRNSGLQTERAAERYRAVAAEHPLASPADRAAYNATLKALINTPVPEGQAFTHTLLGESLICLCNCGIIKNCADYPIQVVMVMLFLLGSFCMRIGDVVGVPLETLVRAYYVRKELEKKFPGEVDPWAPVPWGALAREGYDHFPQYIPTGARTSEAHKYDTDKKPSHVRRSSIISYDAPPLPPALLRPTKDAIGIITHGVVNSAGQVFAAFAVEIDGVPDVFELLMHRRQATLRDILKWTDADYASFLALLKPETIKQVVDTKLSGTRAMSVLDKFYQAYKLAFEAVLAALKDHFGGQLPPVKALAGYLNAARYDFPKLTPGLAFLGDDATDEDIAAMGREIEGMAKKVMELTAGRLGGAGDTETAWTDAAAAAAAGGDAPAAGGTAPTAAAGADDEQQQEGEQEAPPADEEQEEQAAAPAPANNGGGDDNGANGGGDDDDEENSVFPPEDDDDAAGLPPAPAPPPPKTCKKARVAGRSDKMRRLTSGLAADFRTMQSATGLEATTLATAG